MYIKRGKKALLLAVCTMLVFTSSLFAGPKVTPENAIREDGFYYGYGKGKSQEEAMIVAKADLVASALTAELRLDNPRASFVNVTEEESAARFEGVKVKPFIESNKKAKVPSVLLRMENEEFAEIENAYRAKVRESIAAINTKSLNGAIEVITMLGETGLFNILTSEEGGDELLSSILENQISEIVGGYSFDLSVKDGIVAGDEEFVVTVKDSNGKGVDGFLLSILWSGKDVEDASEVKTDKNGKVVCKLPKKDGFVNCPVTLLASTTLSKISKNSRNLRKLDAQLGAEGRYVYVKDFDEMFKFVNVPAGEFMAGALESDSKASKREVPHEVTTDEYNISVYPVTNEQYGMYLHITGSETVPEYFENPDYNNEKQPVVGVSYDDALGFIAWLSEETGKSFRLPTEEEWEKAARAGKDVIYPWGDESPKSGKRANYKGNGKFKGPSPVGAFDKAVNEWGIYDMSGNVWELTSTCREELEEGAEPSKYVVKGGSWMDGPTDLRISNYREIEKNGNGPDIGFRLVLEKGVSK